MKKPYPVRACLPTNVDFKEEDLTKERLIELHRMRLASIMTSAIGYFEGCADEYKTVALAAVQSLHIKYDKLFQLLSPMLKVLGLDILDLPTATDAIKAIQNYRKDDLGTLMRTRVVLDALPSPRVDTPANLFAEEVPSPSGSVAKISTNTPDEA